jgi:hypothetical protein
VSEVESLPEMKMQTLATLETMYGLLRESEAATVEIEALDQERKRAEASAASAPAALAAAERDYRDFTGRAYS